MELLLMMPTDDNAGHVIEQDDLIIMTEWLLLGETVR